MAWQWTIREQQLLLQDEKGIVFAPSAKDVYACASERFSETQLPHASMHHSPVQDIPGLRLSQLSVSLGLECSFENDTILLKGYVRKGLRRFPLECPLSQLNDHIILANTWHYISTGYDELIALLKKASIREFGIINLAQYMSLKRNYDTQSAVGFIDNAYSRLANHEEDILSNPPVGLKATLYPYQETGFRWLSFIADQGCGCILGDEMGLGKTLQVIALIASRVQSGKKPSLVIAPVSLLENWRREFEKFTTGIRLLVHHGSNRTGRFRELLDYDVIVISYSTACSDQAILQMIDWDLVVLDEAQAIKNPHAIRTVAVKAIKRNAAVAVTGTPFENHVTDLWSLMDFIIPGCLGTLEEFNSEISDDDDGAQRIEPVLSPLMLRREVAEVASDLPPRIDIPQVLKMTDIECFEYEDTRQEILNEYGGKNAALPMLQKLRMYCTHPSIVGEKKTGDPAKSSAKYQRVCELLEEITALGEKTLLFTSYNAMFSILAEDIPARLGIPVYAINGSTPTEERQKIIDEFSKLDGASLLVLNPRAAGTGLNITAATRVIHYNLEWNPALEDQASARAYRRGQQNTVFVYRLYYKDTVEEIINERIEKKRDMFDHAVVGVDGEDDNTGDILKALMMSPTGG